MTTAAAYASATATPTKLRNGSWGARVDSEDVVTGETITITTRSGKSWQTQVSRVLWRGKGIAICATESGSPQGRRHSINNTCGYCEDGMSFGMTGGSRCPRCGGEVC